MKKISGYSISRVWTWLSALIVIVLATACGGNNSTSGSIGVSLTDAPACGFDAVYVTVSKVRFHQSISASDTDAGWTDITLNPARKINLLNLTNGVLDNLGATPLAAGHYTQLRLVLDDTAMANSVVLPGSTTEILLVTPSATKSGIKLVNQFDVAPGQHVDLVLDFNACKSIVKRGNKTFALKPVIKVLPYTLNGIGGFVDTTLLNSSVMVSAEQNGVIVQSTMPASNGAFLLSRLALGSYDVVITADGRATAVIASVPVTSSSNTINVNNSITPIILPTSNTHSVNGTVSLPMGSTEVAYVAAKQNLGPSLTVTTNTVAADDLTGNYIMALPVEAPLLGIYSALQPITFAPQTSAAGIYGVEAFASGYIGQSSNVDISTADVTQNFTLAP